MPASAMAPREFPLLDGYRALASLMVLTTHVAFGTGEVLAPVVGPFLGRLDFGVTIFFVLSGFLLYRPWALAAMAARPRPAVGAYSLRRGARILPAYWLMVVVTLVALPPALTQPWQAWPVHLGMVHIYIPGFGLDGLTQTWSLATEVSFYVALPFIAWIAGARHRGNPSASARWQLIVVLTVTLAGWAFIAMRALGPLGGLSMGGYWLPTFMDWFAIGMVGAVIQARLSLGEPPRWMQIAEVTSRATPWCLMIAASLFIVAATPVAGPVTLVTPEPSAMIFKHGLYGLIAIFLLLPGLLAPPDSRSAWARVLDSPAARFLGTVSYGIFLWHLLLFVLIQRTLGFEVFRGGFWVLWPLVIVTSVAVASVSWFAVERPINSWARGKLAMYPPMTHDRAPRTTS